MVGTAGSSGQRLSPQIARQRNVPALMCGKAAPSEPTHLEQFEQQLWRGADWRRSAIVFFRIGARQRDEIFDGLRRRFGSDDERVRRRCKLADGDEILVWIVRQLIVEAVID